MKRKSQKGYGGHFVFQNEAKYLITSTKGWVFTTNQNTATKINRRLPPNLLKLSWKFEKSICYGGGKVHLSHRNSAHKHPQSNTTLQQAASVPRHILYQMDWWFSLATALQKGLPGFRLKFKTFVIFICPKSLSQALWYPQNCKTGFNQGHNFKLCHRLSSLRPALGFAKSITLSLPLRRLKIDAKSLWLYLQNFAYKL